VRVTLDRQTDTLCVSFTEYDDSDIAREYSLGEHDVRGDFYFHLNKRGVLLGFEAQFASSGLPPELLDEAERV
jgi:hypothetical protein